VFGTFVRLYFGLVSDFVLHISDLHTHGAQNPRTKTQVHRVPMNRSNSVILFNSVILVAFLTVFARPLWSVPPSSEKAGTKPPETLSLRGRVVWMNDALARRHGVKTVPEAAQRLLALETADGELHPLVEDIRGRAFRRDQRLRGQDLQLLVRRHAGSPMIQIIRVFALQQDRKFELDYWCDICAIAMFELKACDCCQGPIELRRVERRVLRVESQK